MKNQTKKFSNQLILFVFISSFVLVIGSFSYFYFSGKSYLKTSAIKELKVYENIFYQVTNKEVEKYSHLIEGFFINYEINNWSDDQLNSEIILVINQNNSTIEEVYFHNSNYANAKLCSSVKVYGGEIVTNCNSIDSNNFNRLKESFTTKINLTKNYYLGIQNQNQTKNYFFYAKHKKNEVILKLNSTIIFDEIISQIYFPANMNFIIANNENIAMYSTNKFWVNQKLIRVFDEYIELKDSVNEINEHFILNVGKDEYFQGNLLLCYNYKELNNEFKNILTKIFIYSILIYVIIVTVTFLYSKKISKQLNEISDVTKKVGEGNFDTKISIKRDDELGLFIDSFNGMVDKLKESYEKLNLTNKELEQKIIELVQTKTELTKKEKLALIGETISKISHEIQNKISTVSVWVQNLEMQSPQDETTQIYVAEIKRSLNAFLEMLLNFKKFYRKPYLEKSNVKISNIINKIVTQYEIDIKAKNILVNQNYQFNGILFIDQTLLEEVISNLLVNAIYFSPKNSPIDIETKKNRDEFIFEISNKGPSINEEELENIFNPFFTTKSSGSGLGLAISKNIIESHNGKIEAVNKKDCVSFIFILPLTKENHNNENISS